MTTAPNRISVDDARNWCRAGSGRRFTFLLSLEETEKAVLEALPPEFAPYDFLATVWDGKRGARQRVDLEVTPNPISYFVEMRRKRGIDSEMVAIWSRTISGSLDDDLGYETMWTLNGAIYVQWHVTHGLLQPNDESDIVCTDQVERPDGSEQRDHKEYRQIFNAIKSKLKKRMTELGIEPPGNRKRSKTKGCETQMKTAVGDGNHELRTEIERLSKRSYKANHFADAVCKCGGRLFHLALDENEGVAVRKCTDCGLEQQIGDSGEYLEDANLVDSECKCGGRSFEVGVGISLYAGSDDVKWIYIAGRCAACNKITLFGDWKNEYSGYQELLSRV